MCNVFEPRENVGAPLMHQKMSMKTQDVNLVTLIAQKCGAVQYWCAGT